MCQVSLTHWTLRSLTEGLVNTLVTKNKETKKIIINYYRRRH